MIVLVVTVLTTFQILVTPYMVTKTIGLPIVIGSLVPVAS
uniref:Uncharacterized protein n=1 Tax=Arundo donax TaxID=35708 RepID=A0A0A8YR38_ARUDO